MEKNTGKLNCRITLNYLLLAYVLLAVTVFAKGVNAEPSTAALDISTEIGLGFDDNVYRSPNGPYIDYAEVGNPTVTPDVQSGFFIPLGLDAEYMIREERKNQLSFNYELDVDVYLDDDQDNANHFSHRISLDKKLKWATESGRKRSLVADVAYRNREKIYYDRDGGLDQVSGVTNISDRFTYNSKAVGVKFKDRLDLMQYGAEFKYEGRDYKNPGVVSEYDHDLLLFGASVDYGIGRPQALGLDYQFYTRDYDDRKARDLTGTLGTSLLEYEYSYFAVKLKNRLSDMWLLYLTVSKTIRSDSFVGYADYTLEKIRVSSVYSPNEKLVYRVSITTRNQEYDKAFAFNNPSQPRLAEDSHDLKFSIDFKQDQQQTLWAEAIVWDRNTTDLRYEFNRFQAMVGFRRTY